MKTHPWKCSRCQAVVFIPDDGNIKGGVCTQQRRGCAGELVRMSDAEAEGTRALLGRVGVAAQAWLTLVPQGARC